MRVLDGLNERQREAVCHGQGPLLIIAGAGTGKTTTLVHRVAGVIASGVDPARLLLLTFTRRSAAQMVGRTDELLRRLDSHGRLAAQKVWGGTFHAVATRLLRMYGKWIEVASGFTIHDRSDAEDLLDVVRTDLDLSRTDRRFPKKATCMAIHSRCVNACQPLEAVLEEAFPWCAEFAEDLARLQEAYTQRKREANILDYDDLLVYWGRLVEDPEGGRRVRSLFDCVLVDEYQDTNRLQAKILKGLRPDGPGLTVVGDDAQSIYSFRAATVRNILDFPAEYPGTTIVKLEQNYRSTQPILSATNAVIALARERHVKDLWTAREGGQNPRLVTCRDGHEEAEYVVREILELREAGSPLHRQAVLFRASHHSIMLEAELGRRKIPFVKYGGLRFIETAHVKDLLAFLRLAENPRDVVAGVRVLGLFPGIGPKKARALMDRLLEAPEGFAGWSEVSPPAASAEIWPKFLQLLRGLGGGKYRKLPAQVHRVRKFYTPLLETKYDHVGPRQRDLEQIELLAGRFEDRGTMLAEIALDPPTSTEDLPGRPRLDEDYLVLSTIHSAKGLEWDAVFVIGASDGNIPSDLATGSQEQLEEERRLLYVALTRARNWLTVCFPHQYYFTYGGRTRTDRHGYAQLTRFLPRALERFFERRNASGFEVDSAGPSVFPQRGGRWRAGSHRYA